MSQFMQRDQFRNVAKGELHVHLEGSFRPERVLRLAREAGDHPWSRLDVAQLRRLLQTKTFPDFIEQFMNGYGLLRTAAHFQAVTEDLCATFEEQGVVYAEVLYSPGVYIQSLGRDLGHIHNGIAAGLAQFPRLEVRFVLDTVLNLGSAFMERTLDAVLGDRREFLAGFSVGGGVPDLDMRTMVPLFDKAARAGLFCVAHVGEVDGPGNIRVLVEETDVRRIAHGCAAVRDPAVLDLLARRGIGVDVCLTSNLFTGAVAGLEVHPIQAFLEAGVRVSLSTDDPFYFDTDLYTEYRRAATELGFTATRIQSLLEASLVP